MHTNTHTHTHVRVRVCVYTYTCTYIYTCTNVYTTHTHTHKNECTHKHVYMNMSEPKIVFSFLRTHSDTWYSNQHKKQTKAKKTIVSFCNKGQKKKINTHE